MRALGALIIMMTCAASGLQLSHKLVTRVRQLEAVTVMLNTVKTRLKYSCCPVNDLIYELKCSGEFESLRFISVCADACERSQPFPTAWREALGSSENTGGLKREDITALIAFGESLGTTDIDGQLAVCDLYSTMLGEKLSCARESMKKYSKIYPALGALAGAAVWIIAI